MSFEDRYFNEVVQVLSTFKPINEALLFGSRALGTETEGSDVDLCLKGEFVQQKELLRIMTALDELNSPYKFDVVLYNDIDNPKFKEHIDSCGKVIYQRSDYLHR